MSVRVIPCLQLMEERLVKTIQFKQPRYIGDPVNTVRIFNELEVDELCFLDIRASAEKREPSYELLRQISDECFMPLSYGGGVDTLEKAQTIFRCGFEKVVVNTAAIRNPSFITELAGRFGSQSIVVAVDINKNILGQYYVTACSGTEKVKKEPLTWATEMQAAGAGEILLTSIHREGTWKGFDIPMIKTIANHLDIPVIAHGGGGSVEHIREVVSQTQVGAVALGSLLVYQQKDRGILINFPKEKINLALEGHSV